MHEASVPANNTEPSSRKRPRRTKRTAMRFAPVAGATRERCIFATGTAPSPVPATLFLASPLAAHWGPAG